MKKSLNNKGMTLVELLLSFTILGILLVVAAEIIHSSTEVYYYTKTTSQGIQAAQIVATEIRGDLEDAIPLYTSDAAHYIVINGDNKKTQSIEFVGMNENRVIYDFSGVSLGNSSESILKRIEKDSSGNEISQTIYDSKYIGMGYEVKNICFVKPKSGVTGTEKLPISDCPVIKVIITVCNNQYGEFETEDYISIYGFYGIDNIWDKIVIPNEE